MDTKVILRKVSSDWTPEKLGVIRDVIVEANKAVLHRSNIQEDPLLDTPNLANFRGYLRWIIVSRMLEMAIERNRLPGIVAHWEPAGGGGVHIFEMRGEHTIVTPCHLLSETMTPRETEYRKDQRIVNAINPDLFPELQAGDSDSDPLKILLVHGGKKSEFAYLRAYTDKYDNSIYRSLSSNIMLSQYIVPTLDAEFVSEPMVTMKEAPESKEVPVVTNRNTPEDLFKENSRLKNESPAT